MELKSPSPKAREIQSKFERINSSKLRLRELKKSNKFVDKISCREKLNNLNFYFSEEFFVVASDVLPQLIIKAPPCSCSYLYFCSSFTDKLVIYLYIFNFLWFIINYKFHFLIWVIFRIHDKKEHTSILYGS